MATDIIASNELVQTADAFGMVRDLRSGKTNEVFDQLEESLDMGVIALNGILEESPSIDHAKNYRNMFRRIGEYRAKFPRHSDDTNLDSMVTAVLKLANDTGH